MSGFDPLAGTPLGGLSIALAAAAASSAGATIYEELRDGFAKDMLAEFNTGAVFLLKPSTGQGSDRLDAFSEPERRTRRNAFVTGFPMDQIDGAKIVHGDRRVLIDAADFTDANRPAGTDHLEIDGTRHTIVSLAQIPAAGTAVIYIAQARTGGRP